MKKQLNTEAIANELEGASVYFSMPRAKPVRAKRKRPKSKSDRPTVRTNERITDRTTIQQRAPKERVKVRHSFDVFEDQLVELQARQWAAVRRGKRKPTLGDMVQQALDLYLGKKRSR